MNSHQPQGQESPEQPEDLSEEFLRMEGLDFKNLVRDRITESKRERGIQKTPLITIHLPWTRLGTDNGTRLRKGRMLKAIQDGLCAYPGILDFAVAMSQEELDVTRDMANVFGSGIRRIVEQR